MPLWKASSVQLSLSICLSSMLVTQICQHTHCSNTNNRNIQRRVGQSYSALHSNVRVDDEVAFCSGALVLPFASVWGECLIVVSKEETRLECLTTLIAEIRPAVCALHVVAPNCALDWNAAAGTVLAVGSLLPLGTTSAFDPLVKQFVPILEFLACQSSVPRGMAAETPLQHTHTAGDLHILLLQPATPPLWDMVHHDL